ncbi:MAG: hypothetical protein ABEI99_05790, partial [Halobaculum sp.]
TEIDAINGYVEERAEAVGGEERRREQRGDDSGTEEEREQREPLADWRADGSLEGHTLPRVGRR